MRCYTDIITSIEHLEKFLQKTATQITDKDKALVQLYLNHDDFSLYQEINNTIAQTLKDFDIVGVESNYNINSQGQITTESVIQITLLNKGHYTLFAFAEEQLNQYDFGGFLVRNYCTKFSKALFLYSNVLWHNCQETLCSIKEIAPYISIYGGIIPHANHEFVFLNDQVLASGCVGIIFDATEFHTNSYHNFVASPIGKEHVISQGFGPYIHEIDHIKAKDFYLNQIGHQGQDETFEFNSAFPLLIKNESNYFPKSILNFTPEGYIKLNSNVITGDTICLGYTSVKHLKKDIKQAYETVKDFSAETIYVFKSLSRYQVTSKNTIHTVADDFLPVSGFLTHLEFITNNNQVEICVGSFVVISLSETENYRLNQLSLKVQTNIEYEKEYLVLINLIDNISQELNLLEKEIDQIVRHRTAAISKVYYRDAITQLPNTNKLKEFISKKWVNSLAIIDVQSFMEISHFYGHQFSKKMLYELGQLILTTVSHYECYAYCLHLDVFAVSSKSMDKNSFNTMIEQLIELIHHHTFKDRSLQIQITTTTAISHNLYQIHENAIMTLEYAKANKIDFLIYDRTLEIETKIQNNLIWASNLQSALSDNRINAYYQAVRSNTTGEIVHYEVLLRLTDELGTLYKPSAFLDLSKKASLYKKISHIILTKAFDYFSQRPDDFSINISIVDILDDETCQLIYNRLALYNYTKKVIFELNDSEKIQNYEPIKAFIKQVKLYGALIAIDNLGSGFFNFNSLIELDVDILKIDGLIIQSINTNNVALSLVESILDFAKKIQVITIAKSVSSEAIYNRVKELGFDYSQGYYIAQPVEITEAILLNKVNG